MILLPGFAEIDLHSHLLPGMDHGCVDLKMAEQALQQAHAVGIRTICCTSHFYPDQHHVPDFVEARTQQLQLGESIANKYGIHLIPGAEVQMQPDVSSCGDLSLLALNELEAILIELPFLREVSHKCLDNVFRLMTKNRLQVIIAHPDRYDLSVVEDCLSFGCVLQLNAEAVLSEKKQAVRWMKNAPVLGIGTDFHRDAELSYSSFVKASKLAKKYS